MTCQSKVSVCVPLCVHVCVCEVATDVFHTWHSCLLPGVMLCCQDVDCLCSAPQGSLVASTSVPVCSSNLCAHLRPNDLLM